MGEREEKRDGAWSSFFSRNKKTDAAKRGADAKTEKLANDRLSVACSIKNEHQHAKTHG